MSHAAMGHEVEVARRFDALQERFKTGLDDSDFRLAAIERALGPVRGLTILDLGCGKGRFADRLNRRGARVVGLDVSWEMLKQGRCRDRIQASSTRLPLPNGRIDAVIAVEVLQHVHAIDITFQEIHRVLKPEGRVAIVDKYVFALNVDRPWLPNLLIKRIDERRGLGMYAPEAAARERWFGNRGLCRRLEKVGFANTASVGLLAPDEADRSIFRTCGWTRAMRLWTAQRAGGSTCRSV